MNQYDVTAIYDATNSTTVSASNAEEAAELAESMLSGRQNLCHQCSREVEMGDIIGCHVYHDEKLVLDTTLKAERIKELEAEVARLKRKVSSIAAPAHPKAK